MLLCCLRHNIDWLLVINSSSSFPVINKWCCLSATSARTSTCLGDRSFAAAGPRLWNSLPTYLRQPHLSLGRFRWALKTHLFLAAWLRRLVTICFFNAVIQISLLTYLLTYLLSVNNLPRFVAAGCIALGSRTVQSMRWCQILADNRLPHLHLTPPLVRYPSEYFHDIWYGKN